MLYRTLLFPVLVVALATGAALVPLLAKPQTSHESSGTLACTVESTDLLVQPALRNISCLFEPFGSGKQRGYIGKLLFEGTSVRPNTATVMTWNVWLSTSLNDDASLLGKYYPLREDDPLQKIQSASLLGRSKEKSVILEPVTNPGPPPLPHRSLEIIRLELRPARI